MKGQQVEHSGKPEWGIGIVLDDTQEGKVEIYFEKINGTKKLVLPCPSLRVLESAHEQSNLCGTINYRLAFALCDRFYAEMTDNRPNTDDGSVALKIKQELEHRGGLTFTTRRRLLAWCHTNGSVFQNGVELARQICTQIYGHVPPAE